ncbi:P-loop containing nucleoside triphosphate hydrolase protein [Phycomyces blakesleeanus]|uniref:P-loop containing nucleoside triphosphate hydrolase protein n=1 Tax=Phycomyces blakesleeanus TaxID=4837 RepID=A0ABR3AR76_PHYBL
MALALIKTTVPEADDTIIEYIDGYLKGTEFDDDEDAISEFIKPLLIDAGGDEDKIDRLCEQLTEMLNTKNNANGPAKGLSRLEQTITMANQTGISATSSLTKSNVDLDHVSGRRVQSQVNQDKLRKAEAKIAAKMVKRQEKTNLKVEYEASRLLEDEQKALQEAYKMYNPILDYTSTKSKNKDIKIENFDISFAGRRILTDASLTIAFGRRYGVVGKNGIGKSTLLRAMARREINVPTHISVLYVEQEVIGDMTPAIEMVLRADVWREHLLEKERELSFNINQFENELAEEGLSEEEKKALEEKKDRLMSDLKDVFAKLQEIESDKAESKASAILAGLGFSAPDQKRPTKEFSGGWRMRISLARALFCKPDVLMLDEPDNMLDIPAIVWLENYLKTWPNTLLVVSHDREFLDEVATDILHQHSEKLDYYKGNYTNFYATREERRKAQYREYEAQIQYRKHLQDFIDRWRYNAKRAPQAQSKLKILEKLPQLEEPESEKIVTFQFTNPDQLSPPILQMSDVTFGYTPEKIIIRDINLDLRMDSRIAIVGPNGAGKSTMLKLLTEENQPMSGLVHRNGRLRIAYFTQHHIDQLDLTRSAVGFMSDRFPGRTEEDYRRHLGAFGITGMVGLQIMKTLSGGQKSRVAFAALSAQNPHILVLDEPTNHLDMESMDALQTALGNFKGGVIIVSHDERFISEVCNEIWICADGVLSKFSGTIKDYKELVCPKDV